MTDPDATLTRLEQLKLEGMLQSFQDQLALPDADRYEAEHLFSFMENSMNGMYLRVY
jgi:hypothetical protein